MATVRDAEIHMLIGEALCLDFVNTLYGHPDGPIGAPKHEYLGDYRDLVLWSQHAGILTQDQALRLLRKAGHHPDDAQQVLEHLITLRETLYRIFKSISDGVQPRQEDLEALDQARLQVLAQSRLIHKQDNFSIEWHSDPESLDLMLAPLAISAVDLLTSDELKRLRECGGCDWLFVDKSRNHLRRWCSMEHCGNRAKSRRQYARRQSGEYHGR
jgi:predicted RNA-binding Zn ribbon-like protein